MAAAILMGAVNQYLRFEQDDGAGGSNDGGDGEAFLQGVSTEDTGNAGRARQVTIRALNIPAGATIEIILLDSRTVPKQANVTLTPGVTQETAILEFDKDIFGSFRIRVKRTLATGVIELQTKVFSIPAPAADRPPLHLRVLNERGDSEASSILLGLTQQEANEREVAGTFDGYMEHLRALGQISALSLIETFAPLDFFINGDPAVGSDVTGDGTAAKPYLTMAPAVPRIPFRIRHRVTFTFEPGPDETAPRRYVWTHIPAKLLDEWIYIRVDETRPGAFVEKFAGSLSLFAAAGTGSTVVKSSGLVVDTATEDATVEFLDGLAVGLRRDARDNTVTDIVPVDGWAGGKEPADGDEYRLFLPGVTFVPPQIPSGLAAGPRFTWFGGDVKNVPNTAPAVPSPGGMMLVNVNLSSEAGAFENHVFGPANYGLYGVVAPPEAAGNTFLFSGQTSVDAGNPFANHIIEAFPELPIVDWSGYGICNQDFNGPTMDNRSGLFNGFIRCRGRVNAGAGLYNFLGGRTSLIEVFATFANQRIFGGFSGTSVIPYLGRSSVSFSPAASVLGHGTLSMSNTALEAPLGTGASSMLEVKGKDTQVGINGPSVTGLPTGGQGAVLVKNDAHLRVSGGAPVLGDGAATDWVCNKAAAFNKSVLGADLTSRFSEGSLIERDDSFFGAP